MDYKICNVCNISLPATKEYYQVHNLSNGTYKLRSFCKKCAADKYKNRHIIVPKKNEKKCTRCREVFPLTGEYFYTKITKKGVLKSGAILKKDCIYFEGKCKKCHSEYISERNRLKRMQKYNAASEKELDHLIYLNRLNSIKLANNNKREPYTEAEKLKIKQMQLLASRKKTADITKSYIAVILKMPIKDLTEELIEIKRKQLKFYRYVKSKKDQIRNNK